MFPELDLGFRTVPAYGLLALTGAALGFVVCWLRMRGRRDIRFDVEQALNHYLLLAAGVVIGAKLYSLVLVFPQLIRDLPLLWRAPDVFAVTYLYSGMVFYGGLGGRPAGRVAADTHRPVRFCPHGGDVPAFCAAGARVRPAGVLCQRLLLRHRGRYPHQRGLSGRYARRRRAAAAGAAV